MRIIIADDYPLMHKGLIYFLKDEFRDIEITSVYDGIQLLKELKVMTYDILILDINFPGNESIATVEYIIKNFNNTKVIMFSQNPEDIYALRYLKLGAYGYVQKSAPMDVFLSAIIKVMNGKKFFSDTILDALLNTNPNFTKAANPFDLLSNRELEVAHQLLKAVDYKTIGDILHISPSTISTYKARIFDKLQVNNDADFFEIGKQFLKEI